MEKVAEGTSVKYRNMSKTSNNNEIKTVKDITSSEDETKPAVYIIFFSLLLDLLAFTLILPLFPSLMEFYRVHDSVGLYSWLSDNIKTFQNVVGAPERFNSVLFGGVLGSMFSFLQFLVSPLVGGLSDVYGRKPVMLICLVL